MSMDDTTSDGRMWAAISWGSCFLGIPLGIVPMAQRNDAFALHHAKAAVAVQLTFFVLYFTTFFFAFVFFFCTFGLSHIFFIPLLMAMLIWPIGTGIHGIILALNGDWALPVGHMGLGERLFSSVTLMEGDSPLVEQAAVVSGTDVVPGEEPSDSED